MSNSVRASNYNARRLKWELKEKARTARKMQVKGEIEHVDQSSDYWRGRFDAYREASASVSKIWNF